ncbi:hypothetical protein PG994_003509 [Apiospora phragmitis]|uniref:C2H2-type domain-containing protein n=1 Tax=Apiospora phragmitis TaxID=2905665 RepID=A0ABR1VZL0_9PEZI
MQTIGGLVRDCLKSFDSVLSNRVEYERKAGESLALSKINDEQGKFKVWSGNIGAHRKGTSSLDYRLRDASNLRKKVQALLEDLLEALADVADKIFSGEVQPWDEDEPDGFLPDNHGGLQHAEDDGFTFETELEQLMADIDETINYLYKVSAGLRSTPQHDRLMSSLSISTSHFEEYDIQHVRNKHPNIEDAIAQRLGRAITMRRHYFKYRESHRGKLGSGLEHGNRPADGISTIASSLPDALKGAEPVLDSLNVDNNSKSGFNQTSFATSVADPTELRAPPRPKEAATQEYFECPFCFMILSARTRRAWKKHVFADLRPYHGHPDVIGSDLIETFVTACERPCPDFAYQKCQFCSESISSRDQYRRHIGRHLEQLALFALPTDYDAEDVEEEEEEEGDESIIRADEESDSSDEINGIEQKQRELDLNTIEENDNMLESPPAPTVFDEGGSNKERPSMGVGYSNSLAQQALQLEEQSLSKNEHLDKGHEESLELDEQRTEVVYKELRKLQEIEYKYQLQMQEQVLRKKLEEQAVQELLLKSGLSEEEFNAKLREKRANGGEGKTE